MVTDYANMQFAMNTEDNPRLLLNEVVGLLPATDKTPDIYFGDDTNSEKVAFLTFLSIWFLDPAIQAIIKKRSPSIICAFSPLTGGASLEKNFREASGARHVTQRIKRLDLYAANENYGGRCYQPEWDSKTGEMIQEGLMAVYAVSAKTDLSKRHYLKQIARQARQQEGYQLPPEDKVYRSVSDRPFRDGMVILMEGLIYHPDKLDVWLSVLLREGFADIDDVFDMVPSIAAHEIGHLLSHNTGLQPTSQMESEIGNRMARMKPFAYLSRPWEAAVELTGIALLKMIQKNAGLNYGLPNSGLHLMLPNSFNDIEGQLELVRKFPNLVERDLEIIPA